MLVSRSRRVPASVDVRAEPSRAWAVLLDPAGYDAWLTLHHGWVDAPPAVFAPGVRFAHHVRVLGAPWSVTWTITELAAPTCVVLDGDGPAGVALTAVYEVAPLPGGASRVTVTMTLRGAVVVLAGPVLEADVAGQLRSSLARFRAVVERG